MWIFHTHIRYLEKVVIQRQRIVRIWGNLSQPSEEGSLKRFPPQPTAALIHIQMALVSCWYIQHRNTAGNINSWNFLNANKKVRLTWKVWEAQGSTSKSLKIHFQSNYHKKHGGQNTLQSPPSGFLEFSPYFSPIFSNIFTNFHFWGV